MEYCKNSCHLLNSCIIHFNIGIMAEQLVVINSLSMSLIRLIFQADSNNDEASLNHLIESLQFVVAVSLRHRDIVRLRTAGRMRRGGQNMLPPPPPSSSN